MLVAGLAFAIYRKRQRQRPGNKKAWERKLLADMDLTTASELDHTTARPLGAAAGGYSAPALSLSTGIAAGTTVSSAMKAALAGEVDVMDTSALAPAWVTAPPPLPTPSRVIVAGQRCADLASVYRALQSVGFGAAAAAGQLLTASCLCTGKLEEATHSRNSFWFHVFTFGFFSLFLSNKRTTRLSFAQSLGRFGKCNDSQNL